MYGSRKKEHKKIRTKNRLHILFAFHLAAFYSPRLERIIIVFNLTIHSMCIVYGYHAHTLHTVNNLTETIANWILNVFNAALKLIRWNVLFVVSKWIDHLQAKNHYTIEAHHIVMHRHGSAPTHNSNLRARVALACSCSCSCICKLNWKNTLLVYVNYVCMFVYSLQ